MDEKLYKNVLTAAAVIFLILMLGPYFGLHILGRPTLTSSPVRSATVPENSPLSSKTRELLPDDDSPSLVVDPPSKTGEKQDNLSDIEELLQRDR